MAQSVACSTTTAEKCAYLLSEGGLRQISDLAIPMHYRLHHLRRLYKTGERVVGLGDEHATGEKRTLIDQLSACLGRAAAGSSGFFRRRNQTANCP